MSVDRTAIIARGFLIDEDPRDFLPEDIVDDFYDEWVITFDAWDDCGPYLIGYYISRNCNEGVPVELNCGLGDDHWDFLLSEACRIAGIPVGEIKTYFGVRVS